MEKTHANDTRYCVAGGVFDCLYDEAFTLITAEDSFYHFINYTKEEFSSIYHNHLLEIIHDDEQANVIEAIKVQLKDSHIFMYENRLKCRDEIKWIWISAQLMEDEQGQPYFHCLFHDITKEKEAFEALRISEQRFQTIISETQDIVFEMNIKNNSVYYSKNFETKFGYRVPLENFPASMFSTDIVYEEDKDVVHQAFQSILQGGDSMKCEYRLKYRDEGYRWVETNAKGIRDESGNLLNIIGIITDIDAKKKEIIQSKREASLDPLTGLLNRRAFLEQLEKWMHTQSQFALILVDIDDYKLINDQYGHLIGDQVLVGIAELLTMTFSNQLVGRYGGDEFIIAVSEVISQPQLYARMETLKQELHQHSFSESHVQLYCSMGASLYPYHGDTFFTLFNKADMAMYSAKMNGKNNFQIYSDQQEMQVMPQRIMQKSFHDDVIEYAIDVFLNFPNNEDAIPTLLTYVGMVFGSDRISIFQDHHRIYEWYHSEEYRIEDENLHVVEDAFAKSGNRMLSYPDVNDIADEALYDWVTKRHTYAVSLNCANVNGIGNLIICLEDCHGKRENFGEESYTIYIISEIIAVLLLREKNILAMQQGKMERMHILMEYIPGGLLAGYYEQGYPYFFSNDRMMSMLGYHNEAEFMEATKGMIEHIIYPHDVEKTIEEVANQIALHNEYEIECRVVRKDGSIIWINNKGKLIQSELHKNVVISICVDITQEKEYQSQLEIYRGSSNGGAYINKLDDRHTLIYANDLFYRIYEISQEEFAKNGNCCVNLVYEEDRAHVQALIRHAYEHGEKEISVQFRTLTPNHKMKWIALHATFDQLSGEAVMNGFILDITKEHQVHEDIAHKDLIYRTALQSSNINVWEYDIKKKALYLTESAVEQHVLSKRVLNVPESLIQQGIIHPLSVPIIRNLYHQLDKGVEDIEAEILTKNKEGNYWWERIRYHMIYDEHHQPSIAVAVGEDITCTRQIQYKTYHEQLDNALLNKGYPVVFRCNLMRDHIVYLHHESNDIHSCLTYNELLEYQNQCVAGKEDAIRFQTMLKKETLFDNYVKGRDTMCVPYRRKDASGNLYWVEAISLLALDDNSHDLSITGVIQNIDERKHIETRVARTIHLEEELQIYTLSSFKDMGKAIIRYLPDYQPCALLLFELKTGGNKTLRDKDDAEFVTYLKICFAQHYIMGKISNHVIGVFLYKDVDEIRLREKITEAEVLCNVSVTLSRVDPTLYFGAVMDCDVESFDTMLESAKETLLRNQTSNLMSFKESIVNKIKEEKRLTSLGDQWDFAELIMNAQKMTSSASAIHMCLKRIQDFYLAEDVILWDVSTASKIYEERKDTCIHNLASIMDTDKLLDVFDGRDEIIHMERQERLASYVKDSKLLLEPCLFKAIRNQDKIIALLMIYHPTRNHRQDNFLITISALLVSALVKQKLYDEIQELSYVDSLTKLWNGNRLRKYAEEFQGNRLISLGVLSMDINELKKINHQYGNHYGDTLLRNAALTLKKIFGNADIYRFAGDEFLVLQENVSYEHFLSEIAQLKSDISSLCHVAIGVSWAEKQISLMNLIDTAEEQRSLEKQLSFSDGVKESTHKTQKALQQLLDAIKAGHMKMYLQKKVDSANQLVVGAEALVRYEDDEHGIVPPGKFIPFLESTGLIYYVDIYIYEQVNKLLAEWKKQGITLIPISFNFSRITLLEDQLIDKMNAINEHYQVDRSLLEIEITENMGEIERKSIIKICAQIHEAGYHIALDDFGSKYSNIAFLSDIHFDTLKFDKGLVDYLVGNKSSHLILESIIGLSRKLDIYNVAEGVESKEQVDILKQLGCTYIQGFYYSKPLPYEDFDTSRNYRE